MKNTPNGGPMRPHKIEHGVVLPVAGMQISAGVAQRPLDENWVYYIRDNYDPAKVGELVINKRTDGSYWICNGQHRWWAMLLLGIETAVCEVHYGLTLAEEADLFDGVNDQKAIKAAEHFPVRVTKGVSTYVTAEKILALHGLTIAKSASAHKVAAVDAVLTIVENYGPKVLDRTLKVAEEAFGHTKETWLRSLLGGLGKFLGEHGSKVKDTRLISKLASGGTALTYKALIVTEAGVAGGGGGGRDNAAYRVVKHQYNLNLGKPDDPRRIV